ncbi:MAG: hypothetical protein JJU13_19085 [Balneolaceae bacterium]|nr:hypothetical protein [Balneolaceae bacterium]
MGQSLVKNYINIIFSTKHRQLFIHPRWKKNSMHTWDENESAEELIDTIKGSRTFNRTIEEF